MPIEIHKVHNSTRQKRPVRLGNVIQSGTKVTDLDLPAGATVYADKAYTDYLWEDLLKEGQTSM